MPPVTLADIEAAAGRLKGTILDTPILAAPRLSALTGAEVFVKYENLQATASFKERGALTKMLKLVEAGGCSGVIAMSAGNHAQAVAFHARRLGLPATIVMPKTTPFVKVEATEKHGATVVLEGESVAEAEVEANRLAARDGLTFVHPYDDPDVIAGQGTLALEMLRDVPDLEVLVLPIGGGGLVAGAAIAAKALKPAIEVVGVEAALYPAMVNALSGSNRPVGGPTLAEGIAVKNVGRLTRPVVEALVREVLLVSEAHLERAVNALLTLQKTIAEGAGAAGLAALIAEPERFRGARVGIVISGGNIDPRILAGIMVRELEREDRILAIRLVIADRPGVLGVIATRLGELGANILEVSHRRHFLDVPAKGASLDVTVETRDRAHADAVIAGLMSDGYDVRRLETGHS